MSALAPGDRAFIIRGFCGTHEANVLGTPVQIESLLGESVVYCPLCWRAGAGMQIAMISGRGGVAPYPVKWLSKIEPLSADELAKLREELPA